jgi:hypothetical protein
MLPHQPHRPITKGRIDLLWHDIHPSTQKDAASNLGRFTLRDCSLGPLTERFAKSNCESYCTWRTEAMARTLGKCLVVQVLGGQ